MGPTEPNRVCGKNEAPRETGSWGEPPNLFWKRVPWMKKLGSGELGGEGSVPCLVFPWWGINLGGDNRPNYKGKSKMKEAINKGRTSVGEKRVRRGTNNRQAATKLEKRNPAPRKGEGAGAPEGGL